MLSKKFQLVKNEIESKNYAFAKKLLDGLASDDLTEVGEALHKALYNRIPIDEDSFRKTDEPFMAKTLAELDGQKIKPGISIVSCCMNRNDNLLKALRTWIKLPVDEIVIVDWSSSRHVSETIKEIADDRIKILRVEGESRWILTYGFNVGLRFASYSKILKFDADIEVTPDFISENIFFEGTYIRGNWKFAADKGEDDQKFVNGSFGATKKALQEVGYYNELITTYGWDDSDIYKRLSCIAGCKTQFINPKSIVHLEQEQEERLKHQSVNKNLFLGHFEPTEYYNMRNKYITRLFDIWNAHYLHNYTIEQVDRKKWSLVRLTTDCAVPVHVVKDAEKYATLEMASWISGELWRALSASDEKLKNILQFFKNGSPKEEVSDFIQGLISQVPEPKLRHESLLPRLSSGAARVIECEGLDLVLEIKFGDRMLELTPLSRLPKINEQLLNLQSSVIKEQRQLIFVTSLYDEQRKDRLEEYLYCIEKNVQVFDVLVLYYEESDSTLYRALKARLGFGQCWQKIIFINYNDRPTFEFLFDTTDILFPNDIICVANADIAADGSIQKVNKYLHENAFWALSRHEVNPVTKEPEGLIMTTLGIPNTFSADMWIYQSPRKYRFKSDFPIGSYHCDSFINYYVEQSLYKLYNPCLDINIYHVHDPVFNSSEEKAVRDKEIIDTKLNQEIEFNNGIVPLKGSKWCRLSSCNNQSHYNGSVNWYNTVIKIHLEKDGKNLLQALFATLLAKEALAAVNCATSVWLMLPKTRCDNELYDALELFIQEAGIIGLYIGVQDDTKIEVDADNFIVSDIKTSDLIETIKLIRAKEIGCFLTSGLEMHQLDSGFGLDSNPNYLADYLPAPTDVDSYKLLKALNSMQLKQLSSFIDKASLIDERFSVFRSDIDFLISEAGISPYSKGGINATPEVTFITSVFKGAEFMSGYLENIAVAAQECNAEVIIVDANSPQNEQKIFNRFIEDNPEFEKYFIYHKLEMDPGLYNCWRFAIERAGAEYISNANLDDRRSPFQTKVLLNNIKSNPEVSGAAAAIRATTARNASWYALTDNQCWFKKGYSSKIGFSSLYLTDEAGHVKSQNIMHCMPIWHRDLHGKYGYFDEDKYGTSADWAFWLECTKQGESFLLVPQVLSHYYINEQSHNRIHDPNGIKENRIIADYLGVQQRLFFQQ